MKELGTKSRDDMGVTELSKKDVTIMNLAYFTMCEVECNDDRYEDKRLSLRKLKSFSNYVRLFLKILL